MEKENRRGSEYCYNRACALAEAAHGENSPALGSVLVDFAEFLEGSGREIEVLACQARIREIIVVNTLHIWAAARN